MSHACDVCHHPDRAIIESRIATEPLAAILMDYPHTLFVTIQPYPLNHEELARNQSSHRNERLPFKCSLNGIDN